MNNNNAGPYDLIVVGAGLAGLTAGVRAAELGLRTLVLEKGDGSDYPCNSRMSGGILHLGFHDPFRPPGELRDLIDRLTDGQATQGQASALSVTGARLIDWLQARGARFMRFNPQEAYRWCMSPPRALRAGNDWKDRGPDQILRKLAQDLVTLGATLQLRAQATELLLEDGACIGIAGEVDGVRRHWRAAHVILADGGFQSNRKLYEQHIGANFDSVFQRGARTGTGSGLQMAVAAGAALAGTDRFYGHVLCADSRQNDNVWPYPEIDAIATAGIVVNQTGQRVVDEGVNGVFLANALATLPGKHTFHAVFDQAIWDGPGTTARIPANPLLEKAGGTVLRADSIKALAELMGIDPVALGRTLQDYDEAVRDSALDRLSVQRSHKVSPHRIAQAPFMAIPVCPGITYTMGGIAINEHAEVLDTKGAPIAGLLAAGATTGGLEGGRNVAYIGGLMKAGSFGLIAAERVAALQGRTGPATITASSQSLSAKSTAAQPTPAAHPNGASRSHPVDPAAKPPAHGIARFPVLRATLRFGKPVAILLAVVVFCLTAWLAAPALGGVVYVLALVLGGVTAGIALGYVELIRLITEFLMPE